MAATDGLSEAETREWLAGRNLLGDAPPEDMARAARFLLNDESR